MLISVSTVKDSVVNLQRFVERNLRRGLDHMVVFLDEPDVDCERFLSGQPHVTHVVTDAEWWRGERPDGLNRRQNTNGNLVKALLTRFEWASWLFHIDGDEVLHIDRPLLEGLPPTTRVVHLKPLESVSRRRSGTPRKFKRLLDQDELGLLQRAGTVPSGTNEEYFHGHVGGKSGLRPALDLYVGIHKPRDLARETVLGYEADWLRVLHLESLNEAEFARKWENLLTSGPAPKTRAARSDLVSSMEFLLDTDQSDATRRRLIRQAYRRHVEDDVRTLGRLGLLETIDPDLGRYEARSIPADELSKLGSRLERAGAGDKQVYRTGQPSDVSRALDGLG